MIMGKITIIMLLIGAYQQLDFVLLKNKMKSTKLKSFLFTKIGSVQEYDFINRCNVIIQT